MKSISRRVSTFVTCGLLGALLLPLSARAVFQFSEIGFLSGTNKSTQPEAVSNNGIVVGQSANDSGNNIAFQWTSEGGLQSLGKLEEGTFSIAESISDDGSVITGKANTSTVPQGFRVLVRWTGGGMENLESPFTPVDTYTFTQMPVISGDGSVIFGRADYTEPGNEQSEYYRWTQSDGYESMALVAGATAASTDGSVLALYGSGTAYRWTEAGGAQSIGSLEGGSTNANGMARDGSAIVGSSEVAGSSETLDRAYRWTSEGMESLGAFDEDLNSVAYGVTSDGSRVVGMSEDEITVGTPPFTFTEIVEGAFLWTEADGLQNIADILTDGGVDLTGWELNAALGISPNGEYIFGTGINPDGDEAAWVVSGFAPVPEPATWAALAGVLYLGLAAWRRKRG